MRFVFCLFLALLVSAPPAAADAGDVRDRIVRELQDDGYGEIRISRTLLGRMRFVGLRPDARREIVVNPVTGVILRDYMLILGDAQDTQTSSGGAGGKSGSGGNSGPGSRDDDDDDDDDDDRDDDDDDDDHDNSGPGSSNSGRDDDRDDD